MTAGREVTGMSPTLENTVLPRCWLTVYDGMVYLLSVWQVNAHPNEIRHVLSQ